MRRLPRATKILMQTEDWEKVNEIVWKAIDLDPVERQKVLDELSNGSPEIRREAEFLLNESENAEAFFESPAIVNYATFFDNREEDDRQVGKTAGNYKIIQELGFGGMGLVYLAERIDGKFEQKVALKFLKREMSSTVLRRHFEQERSILASLDHPNIARLLDAGTTDENTPFLAMEYINGVPIDDYCTANDLELDDRLDLFRTVCSAVSYAHRNLVIHRDHKPSNILVTNDGIPKLLDFGISKILSPQLPKVDSATITRLGVMTPSYASPEQLKNESVSTATDIYSLGVILYELLAGQRPFQHQEDDIAEIFRSVIHQDPPLPSSAVSTGQATRDKLVDKEQTAIMGEVTDAGRAAKTNAWPIRPQQIRGDLDNIVLKALKKEPERRYSSAESFADDIRRYQTGRPVSARADTFKYRAQKFIKRNRAGVIASAFVVLAVIAGVIATFWQSRVAATERDRARLEAEKSKKINAYLQNILNFSNPHWLSSNPKRNREATVADAMDEALKNIETDLADEPEIKGEILFTLCQSYSSQGQYPKAEELARKAIANFDKVFGKKNLRSMQTSVILGDISYLTGKFDEAESLYVNAIEYFRPAVESDPRQRRWLAIALNDIGNVHIMKGRFDEGEKVTRESIWHAEQITGRDRYALPVVLGNLAAVLMNRSDFEGSIEMANRALDEMRKLGSDQSLEAGNANANMGRAYNLMGDYRSAEKHFQTALDLLVKTVGDEDVYTLTTRLHMANNYLRQERFAEAEKLTADTLKTQQRIFPDGHFTISFSQRLLGDIYTKTGRLKKGEEEILAALVYMSTKVKEPNHEISLIKTTLGDNLIAQKRYAEARELLDSALDGYLKTRGENSPFTRRCRDILAKIPA